MNWSELRFADYILFRLHWTLCQSIVLSLLGLLGPHRLLDDIVNFMLATFVENWRLLMHCNLGLHMPIVVMVVSMAVQRAFRVRNFDNSFIRVHLHILEPLLVLELIRMSI